MNHLVLLVDGMLSGTGVRDAANGGYLEPSEIGLSETLQSRIVTWLACYEDAHFHQFGDPATNEALDKEGVEIVKKIRAELPSATVGYFSNADMREINF